MVSDNPDQHEMVRVMKQHHLNRSSGTLFVVTGDNRAAKFIFHEGEIVAITLRHLSGMEALMAFPSLDNCKFRFTPGVRLPARPQHLGSTQEILEALENQDPETLPRMPVEPASDNANHKAVGRSYDETLEILSKAAVEYLGPLAIPICREYFPRRSDPPQMSELIRALNQLGGDMQDSKKHHDLVEQVMASVKN